MSTGNSSNPTNIPDNSQLAYQQVPSQITHQMVVDPFSHIQTLTKPSEVKTWIRQLESMKATLKWDDDYTLVMASNTCRGNFQRYVDEIIASGNTFTLDDLCEKLLRNVGARKTPRQCLQAIVEMKQKPEETVFEFYIRLKTGKKDYYKAEGLDNSKSIDALALVDSIVLQAFETGLRSELQEAVRLRQDDYDNLDEALEIALTIESVKSSLRFNSQMDQFEYFTAGVAEINISRNKTPHGQAGRAARGNNFSNQHNSHQQGPRQMTRHPNTGNTFFSLEIIKGYRDRIHKVLGGLEGQQIRKYQMNDVELAPIISLMLQHGTNDYAKFEFSSINGDALQRQEDRDAGLRFNEDRNGKNSQITVSPQDHDSLGEAASLQDEPDYIDTSERNEKLNNMKGNECIFIDLLMNPGKLEKLLEKWNIVLWLQKEVDRLILWERILCLISGVFQQSHSHVLMAAHHNAERSLVKVRNLCYFDKMSTHMKNEAQNCHICMRRNITPKIVPELQKNVFAEISFETWCLDTLGPLPLSGGNKYVFVCVDVRTSSVVLEPVPNVTSETICKFVLRRVISYFAMFRFLLTDCHAAFRSSLFK
ncbi:hypothetical protein QYM36_002540 [Artemia franciscana]|uniref:Integrase catalytic domain-containing protein n=1 Tax=Artemia franciscana TaxID=6661 RepID=A0AA88I8V3_ARTSF|nr:hypothetical protein QYM36_002540 [Artemia franciscana]